MVPTTMLEKASGLGLRTAAGADAEIPVPVSDAVWGELAALSATESWAEKLAAAAGVKVTYTMQDEPAARVLPQAFVPVETAKSAGLVPAMVKLLMFSVTAPVLVRVALMGALVWPRTMLPKASGVGRRVAVGAAVPVP